MKLREDHLVDELEGSYVKNKELEGKITKLQTTLDSHSHQINNLTNEVSELKTKNKELVSEIARIRKFESKQELDLNYLETKNRLLTEALNKRNEDVKALENGNEDLINLLEKWDDKIQKLDEDYTVEKIKAEKYEELLAKEGKEELKIDTESLGGRINFLVGTLEEYRKMLEEDSDFNTDKVSASESLRVEELEKYEDNYKTPQKQISNSFSDGFSEEI